MRRQIHKVSFWRCVSLFVIAAITRSAGATAYVVAPGTTNTSLIELNTGDSLLVEGLLTTPGFESYNIWVLGDGVIINNTGLVTGEIEQVNILSEDQTGLQITNSGVITMSAISPDPFANIMVVNNTGGALVNSGTIVNDIFGVSTVYLNGNIGFNVTNSGSISAVTFAVDGQGCTNMMLTNSGNISVTEYGAVDMGYSDYSGIINSGTISAGSSFAVDGEGGTQFTLVNTGLITAQSETVALGSGAIVTNAGAIKATNTGENAISVIGNGNSITLSKGSTVLGVISADVETNNNSLIMDHGAGASYAYTTSGLWNLIDLSNKPVVTGSAISVGIAAQETADKLLFQRTTRLNDSFAPKLNAVTASSGIWITPYAAHLSRDDDDTPESAPFKSSDLGVTFGKSLPKPITIRGKAVELDVVVNMSANHLNVDNEVQVVHSSGVLAGLLAPAVMEYRGGTLSAKALLGYVKHHGDRTVITNTGSDLDVTADYHSLLGILGAEGRWSKALRGNLHGRFIAGLDISAEAFAAYAESQYFSWNERTLTQLSGHFDAVITHHIPGNKASLFGGLGMMGSTVLGGKTNNYQINQTAVSFSGGHYADTYGRIQGGVNYQLSKVARMTANVDYSHSMHHINKLQGYIGVVVGG